MRRTVHLIICFLTTISSFAQTNVPVDGPAKNNVPIHIFTNAIIHLTGEEVLENGTLVVQGERILQVGPSASQGITGIVHDLKGKHIWPGIVEPFAGDGFVERKKPKGTVDGARNWNDAVHASFEASKHFRPDEKAMEKWRKMGVTSLITHRHDGIFRGTGLAVHTAARNAQEDVISTSSSMHLSFRKGSSQDKFPTSLMGSIALIRQTFLDAKWYAERGYTEQSDVEMEALNAAIGSMPFVFATDDVDDLFRVRMIGEETGQPFIVKGTGYEYLRESLDINTPLILPLDFPEAYDVSDPYEALEVTLKDMQHWENAPRNPKVLSERGIPFAFTSNGLKNKADLLKQVRKAVAAGLDTATAIHALTSYPAELFGLQTGRIALGYFADFLITSGHLLDPENELFETWSAGVRYRVKDLNAPDLSGNFELLVDGGQLLLDLKEKGGKLSGTIKRVAEDTLVAKVTGSSDGAILNLVFNGDHIAMPGEVRVNGMIHNQGKLLDGQLQLADGSWKPWSAIQRSTNEKKKQIAKTDSTEKSIPLMEPIVFADSSDRPTGSFVIRNARVWTNTEQGILPKADVLVLNGKIEQVGGSIDLSLMEDRENIREIDGSGMHLTSGIVDEHVHVGIHRGVNESSQSVTAEVRIGDVVDPDNYGLYRLLAGGVTTAQLLHGSANPIGGQSALIKLRWGLNADGLKIDDAPGHIKFALGENVKQTNWYSSTSRYPKTRMGVEQVFYDAFHRARNYEKEWAAYRASLPRNARRARRRKPVELPPAPRRDLELEALLEILNSERFITCHSYVASEIDMLMHVADSMGFTVNTFTHILEGYKVADKLKSHGASASTFSDWWGYKYEVREGIPYNAAILHKVGVNTGINSDDAEMGRRLNQEAAKIVKYGGVSEEEAWKMVTLNPAKMLKLDDRIGSIEVGKDADLVLWNTNPLRIDAVAQTTFIDGHPYFDMQADMKLRALKEQERQRLIQLMLTEKKNGASTQKAHTQEEHHWHCDTIGEEPYEMHEHE